MNEKCPVPFFHSLQLLPKRLVNLSPMLMCDLEVINVKILDMNGVKILSAGLCDNLYIIYSDALITVLICFHAFPCLPLAI